MILNNISGHKDWTLQNIIQLVPQVLVFRIVGYSRITGH